ncbi:MAG: DUF2608 domain-containing protein [Gammaproteobacteria bacterium]|nr:DUF2608 domain-containing protein [Gammaproteobacteria bacterium]
MHEKHEINHISNIKTALKHINHHTWLVLDLDNTVMESVFELSSDQWFVSLLRHTTTMVSDSNEAMQLVLLIACAVQEHVRTKAVESDTVKIIRALQDIGVPVFALTSRDMAMKQATVRQLDAIGIDFSKNCIPNIDGLSHERGIIFCNGKSKGETWQIFIEQCSTLPQHIVMLDDKKWHLKRMLVVAQQFNINFTGLRYGFLDEKISLFDMRPANHQLAHLKEHLPPDAQKAIDDLQLIPDDFDPVSAAITFSDGFFNHAHTTNSLPTHHTDPRYQA